MALLRRVSGALAALGLLLLLAGCNTGIAEREAERRVRQRLPQLIGPAASYKVNIRAGSDMSVVEGRLRQVTIEGRKVRIGNEWPVDELQVVLDKVRVNTDRQVLEHVGAARFLVRIRPATLTRYLDTDPDNLRDVNVQPEEGTVTISGRYRLVRVWASFRVTGTLQLTDSKRIGFRTLKAHAAGIPVPGPVVNYLEKRLNPLLDVSDVAMPIDLTEVLVRPDGVEVRGTPKLDDPSLFSRGEPCEAGREHEIVLYRRSTEALPSC